MGNYGEGMRLSTQTPSTPRLRTTRTAQAQPAGATDEPTGTIVCVLSEVMGRHRVSQTALAQATGLRPATIHALYHDRTSSVTWDVLARLLMGLHALTHEPYEMGDLFRLR
ncbi:helix-turn-helix transcriptional regulator [Deinococcus marmoris]